MPKVKVNSINMYYELHGKGDPVVLVVGEADILTPRKFSDEIVAGIPKAKLHLLPRLGHAFYEERPEVFNRVALDFWARC